MPPPSLHKLVDECVALRGRSTVLRALKDLIRNPAADTAILTIIANDGVHPIPSHLLRGEVFAASHGNWAGTSSSALLVAMRTILFDVALKLRERRWSTVYLIPTGHPVVSANIKTLVYRILRINTIDLAYLDGRYHEVRIDQREIAIAAGTANQPKRRTARKG